MSDSRRSAPFDVRLIALSALFPLLVITEVVANQPWWIAGVQPGQVLTWVTIATFTAIIFLTPGLAKWPRVLIGLIFAAKIGAWLTGIPALNTVYRIALVASSAVAGSVVALEYRQSARRQAAALMIAAMPLMVLQVSGAGAWTQVLTTHGITAEGESVSKEGAPTLFVQRFDLRVNNVQARPAAFFHASEFASLVIIFAFVLIVTAPTRRSGLAGAAVCACAVLSMAKVVLFTTAVALGWLLLTGEPRTRRRVAAYVVGMIALLMTYRVLYPGLFATNLGMQTFISSVLYRAYDVASVFGYGAVVDRELYELVHQGFTMTEHSSLSGVGQVVRHLPLFAAGLVVLVPAVGISFQRMRRISVKAVRFASTMLLSVTLFLLAGPFLSSPFFWFCMGFGLFPLLTLLDASYLKARFAARTTTAPA